MIIASLGCSGSGKTFYGEELKNKIKELQIICPDDVRAEFGNISDQTHNKEVFEIVEKRLEDAIKNNISVYYSATNLTKNSRKTLMKLCKKYNQNIIMVVFLTSYRPDICETRVKKNLINGINRSNTLAKDENGKTIIQLQAEKFRQQMKEISSLREELKNNSKEYRIKFIECSSE